MNYLKSRAIQTNEPAISRLGLGCNRMAADPTKDSPEAITESIQTIHQAMATGVTFINTADFYGSGLNELLIREALKTRQRKDIFLSVKFGSMVETTGVPYGLDVRPQAVKNYLNYSLKRLGTDYIDLYQPARIDPNIPVEETIGAVADLVKAGYVKHVGISEVDAPTLHKAHTTHPIHLIEVEYSLLNRRIETDLLPMARQLDIGVVAFGVLFHGLIGGSSSEQTLANLSKRMSSDAVNILRSKLSRMDALREIADEKRITLAQLAIAWVLSQGEDITALVGVKTRTQFNDIATAIDVGLNSEDLDKIEKILPRGEMPSSSMLTMSIDEKGLFKH